MPYVDYTITDEHIILRFLFIYEYDFYTFRILISVYRENTGKPKNMYREWENFRSTEFRSDDSIVDLQV